MTSENRIPEYTIRQCETLEEFTACINLQREVWQFAHESAATAQAAQPRRVMGGSDLPARGVAAGRSPLDVADPPSRIVRAFSMYIVLVLVILIGQMGNLPWWSGHPVGDVKTALAAPANITADFKCGNPGFKLCPQPWIGPDPATDRQAFKFPYWSFYWPGTYTLDKKGQPVSVVLSEKPIADTWEACEASSPASLACAACRVSSRAIPAAWRTTSATGQYVMPSP